MTKMLNNVTVIDNFQWNIFDLFSHRGKEELRITCHTSKIALQASRSEVKGEPKRKLLS